MTQLDARARIFAALLAAVAGYVDAAGFLMTGGYFVSFMSGNSTRLGVGLVRDGAEALIAASLIAAFVGGVILGASLKRLVGRRPVAAILGFLALTLAICGYCGGRGMELTAALALAAAMGAENTIFAEAGEVRVGLTYMTGALVKVGKGLAAAMFGEGRLLWAPHALLWLGLLGGASLGAAAFTRLGASSLWFAAGAVMLLIPVSLRVLPSAQAEEDVAL